MKKSTNISPINSNIERRRDCGIVESTSLSILSNYSYILRISDCRIDSKGVFEDLPLFEIVSLTSGNIIMEIWNLEVLKLIKNGEFDNERGGFTEDEHAILISVLEPMKHLIRQFFNYYFRIVKE